MGILAGGVMQILMAELVHLSETYAGFELKSDLGRILDSSQT